MPWIPPHQVNNRYGCHVNPLYHLHITVPLTSHRLPPDVWCWDDQLSSGLQLPVLEALQPSCQPIKCQKMEEKPKSLHLLYIWTGDMCKWQWSVIPSQFIEYSTWTSDAKWCCIVGQMPPPILRHEKQPLNESVRINSKVQQHLRY